MKCDVSSGRSHIGGGYSPKFCTWTCLMDSAKSLFAIPIKSTILGPFNISFSAEKHPLWAKFGCFFCKIPQIHLGHIESVTETHTSIYQISWKYTPKGRHIHIYQYNKYPPSHVLHCEYGNQKQACFAAIPYRQLNKIMAYLTFHKWLILDCNIHMSLWMLQTKTSQYECYIPKPVTCEKWITPLFYYADEMRLGFWRRHRWLGLCTL